MKQEFKRHGRKLKLNYILDSDSNLIVLEKSVPVNRFTSMSDKLYS
jgi:hypothetical protein